MLIIDPPPALRSCGKHSAGEQPDSPDVHIESFIPLLLRDLLHRSDVKDPGIIDEDIETAKLATVCSTMRSISGSSRHRRRQPGRCSRFRGRSFKAIFAAADERDSGALRAKARAQARPMPLPAPVTMAILPLRREFIPRDSTDWIV